MTRPEVLIEGWLPTQALGIESRRENSTGQHPPINRLHVWWARRPLAASAGAVLASLLPAWSEELAARHADYREFSSEDEYRRWFLRLCGILGDPVEGRRRIDEANQTGERLADGGYGYRQAYKNSPSVGDLNLLHRVLRTTWGRIPQVADPTAGGGSIPYAAVHYGLPTHANDLNPVAAVVITAGVDVPSRFGVGLVGDLQDWGRELANRIRNRLEPFFALEAEGERVIAYIFARTVTCPRTGKPVPLAPNWWLSKGKGGTAVRLVIERNGVDLETPEFEIVTGSAVDTRAADLGTMTRGKTVSPWDGLVIDVEYLRSEAQAGRMGSMLYAVATRSGVRRGFRGPTATDLASIRLAEDTLDDLMPRWQSEDVVPQESLPPQSQRYDPRKYGILNWVDFYSPRQLLVHGTFVEEYRKLIPEVRESVGDRDRADALLTLIALGQGKGVNYNALLASWHVSRGVMRSVFDRHDFAFKWTYAEFDGARELYQWGLDQVVDAYRSIAELLPPADSDGLDSEVLAHPVPAPVEVTQGNAGDMAWAEDRSVELVCIDPPYYDNLMYAELSDFFYVWEKRTLGQIWPESFADELTNKDDEAVKNDARFAHAGKQKQRLATLDYERKMTAIFAEARRILTDDGVMTVMFTHKKAEAWDTLGRSLLDSGFTIEASWPVPTESEHSLHQARKNSAASTIFLVCRKREARAESGKTYFESIESEVRSAARSAYAEMTKMGMSGVDRLLSTYGPALSVLSEHWPVYSSEADEETGQARLLRPDEALIAAQEEVVRLQLDRLVATQVEFDAMTDFWLLAWDTFQAREFPFDEARKLCLAVGGVDVDDLARAKILAKKSGSVAMNEPKGRLRRDVDSELPGVNRDRISFPTLVDALHTALYILDLDGAAAARTWLEQRKLTGDARFVALVEGGLKAVPRTRDKGELVVLEAELLERLVVAAFPDIEIPEESGATLEGQLTLGYE